MTNIVASVEKKYVAGVPPLLEHFNSIVNGAVTKLHKLAGSSIAEVLRLVWSQLEGLDNKKGKEYLDAEVAIFPALVFWLRHKKHIGDDKVSVIGHSRGGLLAAQLIISK